MTIREIGEKIEQAFIEIIRERRHDSLGNLAKGALFMGSRIYRRLVQFRIWMYDNRVIRNRAIGCLVVSIGNLSCLSLKFSRKPSAKRGARSPS